MQVIVGITGASGSIIGLRLLEILKEKNVTTHVIVSEVGKKILEMETGRGIDYVKRLASYYYNNSDLFAPLSSGSFCTEGMVIAPCTMKTLAAIVHGYSDSLITRAADVCLKQDKKLILVPRESPLNSIHLKNLASARDSGAIIIPPLLSFYHKPKSIDDLIDFVVGKILDSLGVEHKLYERWEQK